jgi:tRNA (cytidine/uridine-2'-O-)-methyltransferase
MFRIVLVEPEIPPNTGNVIRLAANTGCSLHLVEPLGFTMEDRLLRRAGLDYHEWATVQRHADWAAYTRASGDSAERRFAFTAGGETGFDTIDWRAGDTLVFGGESRGLPPALLGSFPAGRRVRLPIRPGQRSLNLSNAVAVAVFEAWRRCGYDGSR